MVVIHFERIVFLRILRSDIETDKWQYIFKGVELLHYSVFLSVRGRSMHIVQNLIKINLPDFICIFIGQFPTHFVLWPLTSEAKTKISKSNNSRTFQILYVILSVNSPHILFYDLWPLRPKRKFQNPITQELCKISTPNFVYNFIGQLSTHFFHNLWSPQPRAFFKIWPLTSEVKFDQKENVKSNNSTTM